MILPGFVTGESLQELYSNAGLFVLPSYYEGLPIVLLEALSYGLSCVVSDIPANREVELNNDRFFRVGHVESLSEKIREFVNNPLSDEEKARQIDMIRERYDWEKTAAMTMDVYREVHFGNKATN
ncbi:MAG: glycosyltransferase [wastewater metagenome]|nr:glycosyltransferase [Candidatus Loosdrechtia aerotolerans]